MKSSRLLPLLLAPLALVGCHKNVGHATTPTLPVASVHAVTVHVEQTPIMTWVTGTVRPVQRATIAAQLTGSVTELPVTLGQSVQAGDLLVRISAGEFTARLAQTKAELNRIQRDLIRERDLLKSDASTTDMVKTLEDSFAATQAKVHEAETMLGYASIRAPFAGTISRKLVDVGDLATPGRPLLAIDGDGAFEITAGIPDSLATPLAPGVALLVQVPVAGLNFSGKLAEISTAADPTTRTVPVRISVPAGTAVRSGQYAQVQVAGPVSPSLNIPADAVSRFGQLERVFVVTADHKAALRLVTTGATTDSADQKTVEILSGLNDGDQVIVNAPANLRDGQPLTLLP